MSLEAWAKDLAWRRLVTNYRNQRVGVVCIKQINFGKPRLYVLIAKNHEYSANC
jgi:hypothetical protein